MSTTYTADAALGYPAFNDRSYHVIINQTIEDLDAVNAISGCAVTLPTAERPTSTTLNVRVAAGIFRKSDGTLVSYAGTATFLLTASATNFIYLTDAGVLSVSTSAFPTTINMVPLAAVTTDGSTVTGITDFRVVLESAGVTTYLALAGGTMDDTGGVVTVNLGTTNGTKIGGAASQKIGFWGATPIIRPASANQAALTDSTGGTPGTTLNTISDAATADAVASLARLVNQLRADLVAAGLIKGSA
jgi:hypothetical protein